MKTLTVFLIVIFTMQFCSCQKNDSNITTRKKNANVSLLGNWKLAGNYISSGGPQYFVPTTVNSNATFNTNGSLTGSSFPTFNKYTLVDSVTIKFTNSGADYETFIYKINEDTLKMAPIAPNVCIEGCAIVFVK